MERPRALIVEDAGPTRRLLAVALAADGWEVLEAENGETARELARRDDPDVVLLDLLLPDADPFALLAELRELPGWRERPILAVSGWLSKFEEARRLGLPFTDYVTKPFGIHDLRRALNRHRPARPPRAG